MSNNTAAASTKFSFPGEAMVDGTLYAMDPRLTYDEVVYTVEVPKHLRSYHTCTFGCSWHEELKRTQQVWELKHLKARAEAQAQYKLEKKREAWLASRKMEAEEVLGFLEAQEEYAWKQADLYKHMINMC